MAELVLQAETGREFGSASSRRLRRAGRIPAVVYGGGGEAVEISVATRDLRTVLTTEAGLNALINLEIGGESQLSVVKDLQRHPVRSEVLHVDFLRIDRNQELQRDIPIYTQGEAREVIASRGVAEQVMSSLTVWAKPNDIPNEIVVDISELALNEAIRVGDLTLPAGVRTDIEDEEPIVVGKATRMSLAAEREEAAEGEAEGEGEGEGAEDEAGEAEAGADDES
ncbi:MAG: 50S ribosomal protein L25 [Acidimicrobiales bacterium]|nr:50S ribosomal protein L25 [Acidimicrobiales bacterium]